MRGDAFARSEAARRSAGATFDASRWRPDERRNASNFFSSRFLFFSTQLGSPKESNKLISLVRVAHSAGAWLRRRAAGDWRLLEEKSAIVWPPPATLFAAAAARGRKPFFVHPQLHNKIKADERVSLRLSGSQRAALSQAHCSLLIISRLHAKRRAYQVCAISQVEACRKRSIKASEGHN